MKLENLLKKLWDLRFDFEELYDDLSLIARSPKEPSRLFDQFKRESSRFAINIGMKPVF